MADHIVSVNDNFEFPPEVLAVLEAMVDERAKNLIAGNDWIEITLTNGWTSTANTAKYRTGGSGDKAYLELRGVVVAPGGSTAIGTFTGMPEDGIPSLKIAYGTNVSSSANVSIQLNNAEKLETILTLSAGTSISLDGILIYL